MRTSKQIYSLAFVSNFVYSGNHNNSIAPTGPFLCLATSTIIVFLSSVSSSLLYFLDKSITTSASCSISDKDALADGLHLHSAECRPLCCGEYPEIRHNVPRQADDYRTGENKGALSVLDDGGRQGEERPVRHLRGSDSRNGLSGTFHPLARQQEVPP